jgi:hypothetical protein
LLCPNICKAQVEELVEQEIGCILLLHGLCIVMLSVRKVVPTLTSNER